MKSTVENMRQRLERMETIAEIRNSSSDRGQLEITDDNNDEAVEDDNDWHYADIDNDDVPDSKTIMEHRRLNPKVEIMNHL